MEIADRMEKVVNESLRVIIMNNNKTYVNNDIMYLELEETPLMYISLMKHMGVVVYGKDWCCVLQDLLNSKDIWSSISDSYLKTTTRIGSRRLMNMDYSQVSCFGETREKKDVERS